VQVLEKLVQNKMTLFLKVILQKDYYYSFEQKLLLTKDAKNAKLAQRACLGMEQGSLTEGEGSVRLTSLY
jgi:hypothetical protein